MTPRNEAEKRQRLLLWKRQKGKCHWCSCQMDMKWGQNEKSATIDHLDHKWSPERGMHAGERRRVLACWECNQRRGKEDRARYGGRQCLSPA